MTQFAACFVLVLFATGLIFAQEEKAKTTSVADTFFAAEKVVFLGDSITYNGEFLTQLEACLIANEKSYPELLNIGLSSETCSGCSEPAHPWPRPNVHERFERLLQKVEPDLLVVNYGMNDGIYHPFDESRFAKFKDGINKIIAAADSSEGKLKVILVTPPPFDPVPVKAKNGLAAADAKEFNWKAVYENYDSEVMAEYSKWILEQKERVAGCIDLRSAVLDALSEKRKTDPDFFYAHDGVHVNKAGQKLIADTIAKAIGVDTDKSLPASVVSMLRQKQLLMRNSMLTEVGHKRPGIKEGLPVEAAIARAEELYAEISKALEKEKAKQE